MPTASGTASRIRRVARAAASATTTGRRPQASRRIGRRRGPASRTEARSDGGGCRPNGRTPRFDPSSSVRLGDVSIPKTTPARIQIQEVSPQVDCGRYPAKRTVGDRVEVSARIFRDGHETLGAAVRHKGPDATRWSETPLEALGNDAWAGSFEVDRPGLWSFRIEAWVDRVASFQDELRRKVAAGHADLTGELSEGAVLLGDEDLTVEKALGAAGGR